MAVDGAFNEPYGLKQTEANLYIILPDKNYFDSFNNLSDYSKKVFINDAVQYEEGQYLGCEVVHAYVVYDKMKYVSSDVKYNSKSSELELTNYSNGQPINIVVQNRKDDTYENYYK